MPESQLTPSQKAAMRGDRSAVGARGLQRSQQIKDIRAARTESLAPTGVAKSVIENRKAR